MSTKLPRPHGVQTGVLRWKERAQSRDQACSLGGSQSTSPKTGPEATASPEKTSTGREPSVGRDRAYLLTGRHGYGYTGTHTSSKAEIACSEATQGSGVDRQVAGRQVDQQVTWVWFKERKRRRRFAECVGFLKRRTAVG